MANKVRGLTVEIAADASKFKSEIKGVRQESKNTQAELNALQKSLQLEFNSDKLIKAQQIAQQAIDQTAQEVDLLKSRLQYLAENDGVDTSEYQKLEKELAQAELKAQQLEVQLETINQIKFDAIGGKIQNIGNGISKVGKAIAPISGIAAGAIATGAALGKQAIATGDDIATLATQYDMSATALQKFNYVALQTDTQAQDLYKGFVKVRAGVADIAGGVTSTASTALQKLGLDLNSFDGSEEQFYAIIASLSEMEDKTAMVGIANDIFGDKLANNLLPLIYSGTDAVKSYCDEYDELGALTDEQVEKLGGFDNVLNKLNTQFKNVKTQIGTAFIPIMEKFADITSKKVVPKLQSFATWLGNLSDTQMEFGLKMIAFTALLAPLAIGIGKVTTAVGGVIKALPKLMSGLSTLAAHPIILIIAVVAGILALLYTKCEAFREAINNLVSTIGSALQPALDVVMTLLTTLLDLISPIIDIVGGVLAGVINLISALLTPIIEQISLMFKLIEPLIKLALIPLQIAFTALSLPLKMLGTLLGWLAPIFTIFSNLVKGVFQGIIKMINWVLGKIGDGINWVIDKINWLIKKANDVITFFGGKALSLLGKVDLTIKTNGLDDIGNINGNIDVTPPPEPNGGGGTIYDDIGGGDKGYGDTINNDYSTNNKTQNVTVIIQNYADEVDVNELVDEINKKLAEAM